MRLTADARTVWHLLRGASRQGDHARRLQAFYAPQAERYDAFRERLLHGRRELIEALPAAGRVVELGAGTGRNLEFFGSRLRQLESLQLVDLCPALLAISRGRAARLPNVQIVEGDATTYRPPASVNCVYFSYALTMIPDWKRAIDNAIAILSPGGTLGVVDFHLPRDRASNVFWRRWFAHDGVWLSQEHLPALCERLEVVICDQRYGPVPYLPGLRTSYYTFVGRKREEQAPAGA